METTVAIPTLKKFLDDKIFITHKSKNTFRRIENIVGKKRKCYLPASFSFYHHVWIILVVIKTSHCVIQRKWTFCQGLKYNTSLNYKTFTRIFKTAYLGDKRLHSSFCMVWSWSKIRFPFLCILMLLHAVTGIYTHLRVLQRYSKGFFSVNGLSLSDHMTWGHISVVGWSGFVIMTCLYWIFTLNSYTPNKDLIL